MIELPEEAVGLKLYRVDRRDTLVACESVRFPTGRAGVDTVLRRAAISGRVELDGDIKDHFADVLDARHSMIATIALDAASYRALKTKWMRCKVEK